MSGRIGRARSRHRTGHAIILRCFLNREVLRLLLRLRCGCSTQSCARFLDTLREAASLMLYL